MNIKKDAVIFHELIGLKIKVLAHSDPTLVNRAGLVVDETMNTLVLLDESTRRRIVVPKLYGIFELKLPSNEYIIVDGTLIHGRPEDRLKRMQR